MDTLEKYIEAAIEHGKASKTGDYKTGNRAYKSLAEALSEMQKQGDKGEHQLLLAVKNENTGVACWAATHLLPIRPDIAVPVLTDLANRDQGMEAFNAQMVLQEWKAGRLGSKG